MRHANDVVTEPQLGVGESRFFASKHDPDAMFVGQLDDLFHSFPGFDNLRKLRTAFAVRRAHEPVQAGHPAPSPTPEQAGNAQATEPAQAKQPALALPAATPDQQQLEKDTAQLLHLVQELKVEVDKAGTDTLSLIAVRKADEIQKLAKNLKERMREREQEPGNKP